MKHAIVACFVAAGIAQAIPAHAQGAEPGRRWALIITGERAGPRNQSAKEVAALLRQSYGYGEESIQELPGATLGSVYASFNLLTERVRRTDSLVVYVGARTISLSRAKTIGEQIVLADSSETEPWTLLGLSDLVDRVRGVRAAATLLILDDCLQVDSGYPSQRSSSSMMQQRPAYPTGSATQVLAGCPSDAFGKALAAALKTVTDAKEPRRLAPRDLAARMTAADRGLRVAATGDGPFVFERVDAPEVALGRLNRANDPQDRQRAINEMVRTALSDKTAANVKQAHSAFMTIAADRGDDQRVRIAAIRGIGLIGPPNGERDLAGLLRDERDLAVLSAGISALEGRRTPAAVTELEQLVDAPNVATRAAAIRALGRMESRPSLPRILGRLATEPEPDVMVAALEVVPVLGNSEHAQAVNAVIDVLRRPHLAAPVESAAVAALGLLRTPRAEQVLTARLNAERPEAVRAAAAIALSNLEVPGTGSRERALIAALNDSAHTVRESAAFALGRLKATGATAKLTAMLLALQEDIGVRAAAAIALGEIAASSAARALVTALDDKSPSVRRAAATAVGKIGDRGALEGLRKVRDADTDPYVRTAAANAIASLSNTSDVVDDDLRSSDPERRRDAIARVAKSGRPDAVKSIVDRLADADPEVVSAAVSELQRMTNPDPTQALIDELGRADATVEGSARRRGAALALASRSPRPPALDALLRSARDSDVSVRGAVLSALAQFDDDRVLEVLRDAETSANAGLREDVADAWAVYGITLHAKERYDRAITAFESAQRLHTQLFGANDPQVAVDLNNLGVVLQSVGRLPEADATLQQALQIREEVLGPNDPETATTLVNLATVYSRMSNYQRAEPLYLRALKIRETVFGPTDASMASVLDKLSAMYKTQGRTAEANTVSERAATIRRRAATSTKGH